ncbi:MAG: ATP-dependent sacrificial sulfur transferase LarE [bacterium]
MDLSQKHQALKDFFQTEGRVLVAFSGGVDSTLLIKVATDTLGAENAMGVTAKSETLTDEEFELTKRIAAQFGFNHKAIEYSELEIENYATNPANRCYFCKHELFERLAALRHEWSDPTIVEGSHYEDLFEHRPGMTAARELGVRSPLQELKFTKDEIRRLAKDLGLPNWNKPSGACLSSRFPYGQQITREGLDRVGLAEQFLRSIGVGQCRVRHVHSTAKIEVLAQDFPKLMEEANREAIVARFKELGFVYITMDLAGYRSGAMNEVLPLQKK